MTFVHYNVQSVQPSQYHKIFSSHDEQERRIFAVGHCTLCALHCQGFSIIDHAECIKWEGEKNRVWYTTISAGSLLLHEHVYLLVALVGSCIVLCDLGSQ